MGAQIDFGTSRLVRLAPVWILRNQPNFHGWETMSVDVIRDKQCEFHWTNRCLCIFATGLHWCPETVRTKWAVYWPYKVRTDRRPTNFDHCCHFRHWVLIFRHEIRVFMSELWRVIVAVRVMEAGAYPGKLRHVEPWLTSWGVFLHLSQPSDI